MPKKKPVTRNRTGYEPAARRWLWVGVISFAAIILLLWGWSTKLELAFLSLAKSPEGELVAKTKANWDSVFAKNKQKQTEYNFTKNQLKNIISQIFTSRTQSSATTSVMSTGTLQ